MLPSMPRVPTKASAARKLAPRKSTVKKAVAKVPAKSRTPSRPKPLRDTPPEPKTAKLPVVPRTAAERDRRFNLLLQTACLKAGSAAAITAITNRLPLLARLAPMLLGTVTEAMALGRIHQQLVRDILDVYDLDLTELEERGVILLATAANLGAQQLSKTMVEQIVKQLGGRYLRPIAARALPLASLVTEIATAIASTYTVGKRAQVLCSLPGSGARNLADLLRGLTGIDQHRLFSWSGEALRLALAPFRSVLSLIPGVH